MEWTCRVNKQYCIKEIEREAEVNNWAYNEIKNETLVGHNGEILLP